MCTFNDNSIRLDSPTTDQCENVVSMMSQLRKEQQTGKEWSISLSSSSPESAAVKGYTVRRLYIRNTNLDSDCVLKLSEILKSNEIIKRLELWSCSFHDGFKQAGDVLFSNTNLKELMLWHVDGIADDISDLSKALAANEALKNLWLSYCDITDDGIKNICNGLTKNETLTELNIGGNDQITSNSSDPIAKLIETTTSLTNLRIYGTSLNDDIEKICTSLAETKATELKLYLSRENEEKTKKLASYEDIKKRLDFSYY